MGGYGSFIWSAWGIALVVLTVDGRGRVVTREGVQVVGQHGANCMQRLLAM